MEAQLEMETGKTKVSFFWTLAHGFQQLLACVGATVLGPILMGIPPNMALFTSGLGTIPYVLVTGLPIFLGSSFAYIPAIAYVMENGSRAEVAGGILLTGLVSIIVGIITKIKGVEWIKNILPTVVNANILIAIGQVLAPVAKNDIMRDFGQGVTTSILLGVGSIILFMIISLALKKNHPATGLPILITMVTLFIFSIAAGWVNLSSLRDAPMFVLPEIVMPHITLLSITIMIPAIATISENFGDVQAIGLIFNENLTSKMWLSYIFDGVADILSIFGNPSTPYNESIGATQMAVNQKPHITRSKFKYVILVAAVLAISAGFMGKVTPLVMSIPSPIIGGIFWIILGIISLLGLKLFKSDNVSFRNWDTLKVTIPMTITWVLGALGTPFPLPSISLGETQIPIGDFGAIAVAALIGIFGNQIKVKSKKNRVLVTFLLSAVVLIWGFAGGATLVTLVLASVVAVIAPFIYEFLITKVKNFDDRKFQVIGAIGFTAAVIALTFIPGLFGK